MSLEQKPRKRSALENGRVPAELSHVAQHLCGRIPAEAEGVMENFGRIPSTNALIAQSAKSAQPTPQIVKNTSQVNVATGKPSVKNSFQKMDFPINRKTSQ